MDIELRHNIRQRWLLSLFELSHLEYQKRLWIENSYPGFIGDSSEAFGQYFNDLNLEDGYDYFVKEGIVNQQEADIIKAYHKQLDSYCTKLEKRKLSDIEITKDAEWINLTNLALGKWNKLKLSIVVKREIEFMNSLEAKFLR
jgi:hypothetical protein